jgi:hypothetical protein
MAVVAYVLKNAALLVGIVEALLKALAGIVSLTPTKKDDTFVAQVDEWFSKVKAFLYDRSDAQA